MDTALMRPSNGALTETIMVPTTSDDEVTIFVGVQNLMDTTLGEGGPAGAGFGLSGSGVASEWVGAVADAEAQSNAGMGRGGGPTIGSISNSISLGGTTANYTVNYGIAFGTLWFDVDSNNDGNMDFYAAGGGWTTDNPTTYDVLWKNTGAPNYTFEDYTILAGNVRDLPRQGRLC